MNCIKCKKEIPPESAFCMFCGAKQERRHHIRRANGTGSIEKRGDKYLAKVRIYDPELRTLSKTFDKRKDALNAIPALRAELEGKNKAFRSAPTLDALYEGWVNSAALKLSKSKQTAYKIAYRRIEPIIRTDVSLIDINALQGVIDGLTYYQAKDVKSLLSHLFDRAVAQGDARANLTKYMVLPDLEEKEAQPFSDEEVQVMWKAWEAGDTFVGFLLLMIYTGMMPGELCDAKKSMIDWEHQRIVGAGKKTKERKDRSIMIPDIIIPVLQKLVDHPYDSIIGTNKWYWYDWYHDCCKRIGVRDLPPYACRHTTATALALGDKVAPLLITRIMRQKVPMTTERYKHAEEQQILDALNTIK